LTTVIWRGTEDRYLIIGVTTAAVLVLVSVFAMRWNVVIGGQELSKTMKGLLVYVPEVIGREGMLVGATLLLLPFGALWVLTQLFSPWVAHGHGDAAHSH
jgi:predicted membrane protein